MKLIILAFILSITLHILFFSSYKQVIKKENPQATSTTKKVSQKKSTVRYVKLLKKPVEKPKPKKVEKPKVKKIVTKASEFKKVKKITPQKKTSKVKKVKKIREIKKAKKTITKQKVNPKQLFVKKEVEIKPTPKRKTIPKKSLENFLLQEPVPLDMRLLDEVTKRYLRLYGKEYDSLTKVQKVFLQNNLREFHRITQGVLNRMGYPRLAHKLRLSGTNVVEFMFHPDGSITNLKISYKSKYEVFDKYTLELIEIAYKDYPRPKESTKIKFYVNYRIY